MKSIYSFILLVFSACLLLTSCSVENETYFNKDFSGTASTVVDLSEMMDMMSSFGAPDDTNMMDSLYIMMNSQKYKDSLADTMTEVNEELAKKGITGFDIGMPEKGKLKTNFTFDSLDALSQMDLGESFKSMSTDQDELGPMLDASNSSTHYEFDGKWLHITWASADLDGMMSDMEEEEEGMGGMSESPSADDMDGMMSMFGASMKVEDTMHFKKKIKEVKTDLEYTKTKKSITLEYSLTEMMNVEENAGPAVSIRFK